MQSGLVLAIMMLTQPDRVTVFRTVSSIGKGHGDGVIFKPNGLGWCRVFEYWAIMTLINQTGITVFRAIAAIGRAVVLCNVLAFIYIAYALLFCGFIIPLSMDSSLFLYSFTAACVG